LVAINRLLGRKLYCSLAFYLPTEVVFIPAPLKRSRVRTNTRGILYK